MLAEADLPGYREGAPYVGAPELGATALKIGFVMSPLAAARPSPIVPGVMQLLAERGAAVDFTDLGEELPDISTIRSEHDLYVLASTTATALSLAGVLYAAGARTLNPYPSVVMCQNRIVVTRMLQKAGIPVPQAFFGTRAVALARLMDGGPIVLKPSRGSAGPAFRVTGNTSEPIDRRACDGPFFAQRYLDPDDREISLCCVDGHVYGAVRSCPTGSERKVGRRPHPVSAELYDIALRCGQAVGMSLYGLEVVESAGQAYVVDLSPFPDFMGTPEASLRLADYIYAEALRPRDHHPRPVRRRWSRVSVQ